MFVDQKREETKHIHEYVRKIHRTKIFVGRIWKMEKASIGKVMTWAEEWTDRVQF